jgi:D-alanyl-D-alanine dipeptidase
MDKSKINILISILPVIALAFIFFVAACGDGSGGKGQRADEQGADTFCLSTPPVPAPRDTSPLERRMIAHGLVNVNDYHPQVAVALKYASTDNFIGINMYGGLDQAYLVEPAARQLARAQELLDSLAPGHRLLVFDAARPRSAQQLMYDSVVLPPGVTSKRGYVADPRWGSVHNFGAAVDAGILGPDGQPLDMGTGYDHFGPQSRTDMEHTLLAQGKLTEEQIENRRLLRQVMNQAGFSGINSEWWHFNYMSRRQAAAEYRILE